MDNRIPATTTDLDALEAKLKLHFDFAFEKLANHFRGIFNDRTVDLTTARLDHERRIKDLENRVGVLS